MLYRLLAAYLIGTGFLFSMAYTIENHNGAYSGNPAWVLISTLKTISIGIGVVIVCVWLYGVWLEDEEACSQKAEEWRRKQEAEVEEKKRLKDDNLLLWKSLDEERAKNQALSRVIASLEHQLARSQKQLEENEKAALIAESVTATQEEVLSQFI